MAVSSPHRLPRRGPWAEAVLAFSAVFAASTPAAASGFDVPTVGTSVSGPTTADAAAVHFNPAMLSGLAQPQLLGAAQLIVGRVQYTRSRQGAYQYADGLELQAPISPSAYDPTKTSTAASVSTTPIAPSGYLFAAGPVIKDRLWLGGGLYAPYAAVLEFPDDGAQRWQVIDATLLVSQAMFSVAVRAHDKVSLGASIGYVGTLLEMHRLQDFAALETLGDALAAAPISQPNSLGPNAPTEVRELETLSRPIWLQRTVGHSVTFNAGVVVHPGKDLDLALSYQHGTRVRAKGRFVLDMDDPFFTTDLEAQGLDFPARVKGTSRVTFRLPKRLTVGIGGPVHPKVRLDGVLTWSRWSDLKAFDITLNSEDFEQPALGLGAQQSAVIVRDFNDALDAKLQVRGAVGRGGQLLGSVGYASPAAPTSRVDVITPDGHHVIASVGYRQQLPRQLALIFDTTVNYMVPRRVEDSVADLANGEYRFLLAAFGVHLQATLPSPSAPSP